LTVERETVMICAMPTGKEYTIGELADLAGTTPRTVRYYVALGLLPSPGQVGPGARYSDSHLARLRLIRKLQREHQPLAEIRSQLHGLRDEDVEQLLDEEARRPRESALEYIRGVLGDTRPTRAKGSPAASGAPSIAAGDSSARASPSPDLRFQTLPTPGRANPPSGPAAAPAGAGGAPPHGPPASVPSPPSPAPDEAGPQRSQWERVALSPDVELHVRRPLSRLANKRVERLIAIARELLEEDQP
jgi:DNA-binding transcriptional MerR regulator